ncbi:MAG: alpha/beta fold hydrolase [Chloroflexi bacterium]|nr:alpha/beta fold hydrolase [Chloroflexota bacterium]
MTDPLQAEDLAAFARSLGVRGSVTDRSSLAQTNQPPLTLLAASARLLGLGPVLPSAIAEYIVGLSRLAPDEARAVLGRIRRLDDWGPVWLEEAERRRAAAEGHEKAGALCAAWEAWSAVLACQRMALFADGLVVPAPTADQHWYTYQALRRTHGQLWRLEGRPVHELLIPGPEEKIPALFHLPGDGLTGVPTVVLLHGLSGYKEYKDHQALPLRDAGYATLCIDMPAHGERYFGRRLRPHEEPECLAALDWLAAQPEVDPQRVALMGGSMGGYWALRSAAAAAPARACVALATPYALGLGNPAAWSARRRPKGNRIPFLLQEFARVMGTADPNALVEMAAQFTLEGRLSAVRCPLFLGHGTQDRTVPFSELWRLAREAPAEATRLHAYEGADHELAGPAWEQMPPILEWLEEALA